MKNKLLRLLVVIGLEFVASQSNAQQAPFTLGIDRSTGRLIATDVWISREYDAMNKDSGHMVGKDGRMTEEVGQSHYRTCFILGNTFELETNGTILNGSMIVGYYADAGDTNPNNFINTFWVETSDEAGSLGAAYFGYDPGNPRHDKDVIPISQLKVEALSHEKTKAGETLWILKWSYSIQLQKPIDFMPDIHIDCTIGATGWGYDTRRRQHRQQKRTTIADLKRQFQQSIVASSNLAKTDKINPPAASIAQPTNATTTTNELPEITLSITKQDGFLLITFSPVVTGANLEQANINSYPWAWQPAITATNSATNGWYVVPTIEPRVFRVRIDR